MLRLTGLSMPLGVQAEELRQQVARRLGVSASALSSCTVSRRSVDARDKGDVHLVLSVDVLLSPASLEEKALKKCRQATRVLPEILPPLPNACFPFPPVVVGAGPAGLFAALELARAGANPILIERGKPVEERRQDVDRMSESGILLPESNVQFGEGGAGAFSDGKLTCGVRSPFTRQVLETFVRHGAPEEILYLQKPHIGTDRLRGVVSSMRGEILSLGGKVLFNTRLEGITFRSGQVTEAIVTRDGQREIIPTRHILLCIGHSARDTVRMLFDSGVHMEQKPFAIGVRVEHPQAMVSQAQYGRFAGHPDLGPADYKLSVRTPDGRGAYTFCMCPGGHVIAAASEPEGLVVNGMSYHARDGVNANAALLVGVHPGDYGSDHPLAGMSWQRSIEVSAFRAGGGCFRAPVQRVEDLLRHRASSRVGSVQPSYRPGVTPADLRSCLPEFVIEDLILGIQGMDRQLKGFAHPDALLTGVETRSSSPVRMPRDDTMQSEGLCGLFPVGEGAGYAGGIVSAALDGIRAARSALQQIDKKN